MLRLVLRDFRLHKVALAFDVYFTAATIHDRVDRSEDQGERRGWSEGQNEGTWAYLRSKVRLNVMIKD